MIENQAVTAQNYKAIFFDWGGVIANDPGDEFLAQVLRNVGATELQNEGPWGRDPL